MAIAAGICNIFKQDILKKKVDILNDTFKMALYTASASVGPTTTAYATADETSGVGYVAGGQTMTGGVVSLSGNTAIVTFNDVSWLNATIEAAAALVYDVTNANSAVLVLDLGGSKSSTAGEFRIIMPTFDALNALIRIL